MSNPYQNIQHFLNNFSPPVLFVAIGLSFTGGISIGWLLCKKNKKISNFLYNLQKYSPNNNYLNEISQNSPKQTIPQSELSKLKKEDYKLIMVVRNDLKMGKGKIAAQCAHAAVECYHLASARDDPYVKAYLKIWLKQGQPKIVVKVDSEAQLLEVSEMASSMGHINSLICDAGKTQLVPGTCTVVGIGPAPQPLIDHITRHLKLL